jgi:hypothetical protein
MIGMSFPFLLELREMKAEHTFGKNQSTLLMFVIYHFRTIFFGVAKSVLFFLSKGPIY